MVSVPSRLPKTIWAPWLRAGSTARKYVAAWGGRSGVFPSIMSPTAVMVTEPAGAAGRAPGAAGLVVRVAAGLVAGPAIDAGAGSPAEQAARTSAATEPMTAPSVRASR